eukprot:SAG31_NODE_865_length_11376_cov_4.313377_6_plen_80_part_00
MLDTTDATTTKLSLGCRLSTRDGVDTRAPQGNRSPFFDMAVVHHVSARRRVGSLDAAARDSGDDENLSLIESVYRRPFV